MEITPVILEGQHVRLEPLSLEHLDRLSEVATDEALWRFTLTLIRNRADLQQYIETAISEQREGKSLPFVIVHKAAGNPIGSTRYGNIDKVHKRVEIGWTWVAKPWQRTAVNTECKYLLLGHAFEKLGCIRVEFKTDSLNEQSRKALLRIGAHEEGIFRNHMITPTGRIRHSVYFSITDSEWPEVKRRLEEKLNIGLPKAL